MTSVPNEVFLSYKAEDRARVHPLVDALASDGFTVWWDQHIGGGSNWREDIEQHLDAARCVIVVWSELTVGPKGAFVRDEASQAQEAGRYLPITIDDVRPPLGFRERQAISLVGWKGNRDDPRYRSLAEAVRTKLSSDDIPGPAVPIQKGAPVTRRAAMIGAGAAGVLAFGGAGYWFLNSGGVQTRRIAVLPFANMSGDSEQDYFADGLTEELRGALSRAGIEVIGRNSSEAVADNDTATIVEKLNVSHVLTGSVRKSPQTMRIGAQLVDGDEGVEQWAETYDRAPGDAITIQTDIAEQVAGALSVALGVINEAIELGGTSDAMAQDYLFRANEVLSSTGSSQEGTDKALELLRLAVERDPKFARAWIKLGDRQSTYAGQFSTSEAAAARLSHQSERNIRRGMAIAPNLGVGHAALGLLAVYRLNMPVALAEYRKALSLSPNDLDSLKASQFLPWIGTIAEAETAARRAVSLDPLRPTSHYTLANMYYASGRTAKAIEAARRGLALSPDDYYGNGALALSLIERGLYDEALRVAEVLPEGDWVRLTALGLVAARRGQRDEMMRQLAALEEEGGDLNSFQYAQIHAQAGNIDRSFAALDTAMKKKDPGLVQTMRDPFLKPLRDDPRFGALIKRLNFPVVDPGIIVS